MTGLPAGSGELANSQADASGEPPWTRLDVEADVARLWDVLSNGGIAIYPTFMGYGIGAGSTEALRRLNSTKRRGSHKRNGILMGAAAEREVHIVGRRQRAMIDCVTQDYDLPLGVIAPYHDDHPLLAKLDDEQLSLCTARGTISTALSTGPVHEGLAELSLRHQVPLLGSSANLSGSGAKARVEDIEDEVLAIADLVIDHGLCRYHREKVATTQINFATMRLSRWGVCFEVIRDVLVRHFGWELPPDPGREVAPHGHVDEFALARDDDRGAAGNGVVR